MFSYNTKITNFNGNYEVRHYKNSISRLDASEKELLAEKRLNDSVLYKSVYNPFTGLYESCKSDFQDAVYNSEHSLDSSVNRTKNNIYSICRANNWEYFVTLTFDPEKVDSTDYDCVVKSLSKWLEYIKSKYSPDLKYILVPELHHDGLKYHFHGLFSDIGDLKLNDSGIRKNGYIIYNLENYKKGFSTVSAVQDSLKASGYILKYITKELCSVTKNKKRYWSSRNLNKPDVYLKNFEFDEIIPLCDSLGEITYSKNISVESRDITGNVEVFNSCNIFQINSRG